MTAEKPLRGKTLISILDGKIADAKKEKATDNPDSASFFRASGRLEAFEEAKSLILGFRKEIEKKQIEWKEYARCHDTLLTKDGQRLKKELLTNPYKSLLEILKRRKGE